MFFVVMMGVAGAGVGGTVGVGIASVAGCVLRWFAVARHGWRC